MRSSLTCLTLLLAVATTFAQAPQAFNYQGVARDASGDALANTSIGVLFQLHRTTASGAVVYGETHSTTTNDQGLFSLQVGTGASTFGALAEVDWAADAFFLEVGLDPTGGSGYMSIGTQQLLSVPYAMHAETANEATSLPASSFLNNGTAATPDFSCLSSGVETSGNTVPVDLAIDDTRAYFLEGTNNELLAYTLDNPNVPSFAWGADAGLGATSLAVAEGKGLCSR